MSQQTASPKKRVPDNLEDRSQVPDKRQKTNNGDRAVTKKKVYVLSEEKENLANPNLPFEHNYTSKQTLTLMRKAMLYDSAATVETNELVEAVAVMEPEYDRIQQNWEERLTKLEDKMEAMQREHTQTKNELAQTKVELAQTKEDLAQTKEELAQTKEDLAQTKEELARLQTEHEQLQLKVFFRQAEDDEEKVKNKAEIEALTAEINMHLQNHRDDIDKYTKLIKDLLQKHTGAMIQDIEEKVEELLSLPHPE